MTIRLKATNELDAQLLLRAYPHDLLPGELRQR